MLRPRDHQFFDAVVHATLAATAIPELLQARPAVVLERIARGGGATNWYHCKDAADLAVVESMLRPGSVVSFYFDDRMRWTNSRDEVEADAQHFDLEHGDCVVGAIAEDGVRIDATIACSREDLAEVITDLGPRAQLMYGRFPGPDNDGAHAVTVQIPDADGVTRPHPH